MCPDGEVDGSEAGCQVGLCVCCLVFSCAAYGYGVSSVGQVFEFEALVTEVQRRVSNVGRDGHFSDGIGLAYVALAVYDEQSEVEGALLARQVE
jgi:hypothetical protein